MPVSGVVIKCRPEAVSEVEQSGQLPDAVEISQVLDDGTIVAVIATTTVDEEVAAVSGLMAIDGVLDVMVAYHNFEDLVDLG